MIFSSLVLVSVLEAKFIASTRFSPHGMFNNKFRCRNSEWTRFACNERKWDTTHPANGRKKRNVENGNACFVPIAQVFCNNQKKKNWILPRKEHNEWPTSCFHSVLSCSFPMICIRTASVVYKFSHNFRIKSQFHWNDRAIEGERKSGEWSKGIISLACGHYPSNGFDPWTGLLHELSIIPEMSIKIKSKWLSDSWNTIRYFFVFKITRNARSDEYFIRRNHVAHKSLDISLWETQPIRITFVCFWFEGIVHLFSIIARTHISPLPQWNMNPITGQHKLLLMLSEIGFVLHLLLQPGILWTIRTSCFG